MRSRDGICHARSRSFVRRVFRPLVEFADDQIDLLCLFVPAGEVRVLRVDLSLGQQFAQPPLRVSHLLRRTQAVAGESGSVYRAVEESAEALVDLVYPAAGY